jgi:flavin reductase (DIM6/NTAB) family NADH-FMN oxidoreductase RutF
MLPRYHTETAAFRDTHFPLHLALLSAGHNMMPLGNWVVISKEPFRFLIAVSVGNYTLQLLQDYNEAVLHFMPWSERERVVRAGWMSGREVNRAERLGFSLEPADRLRHTALVTGYDSAFELVTFRVLEGLSREFVPYVMDVVAVHGGKNNRPILFDSRKDFATVGERWRFSR